MMHIKTLLFFIIVGILLQVSYPSAVQADDRPQWVSPNVEKKQQVNGIKQDPDILGKIAQKYYEKASAWGDGLVRFAKGLFYAFLIIDVIL